MGRLIAVARLLVGWNSQPLKRRWWWRAVGRGPVRSGLSRRWGRSAFEIVGVVDLVVLRSLWFCDGEGW